MVKVYTLMSTGLPELDEVIQGVRPGDNIVWQVDAVEEYMSFVQPFCRDACKKGNNLVYFRFAQHAGLIPEDVKVDVYDLHPEDGFETFIAEIFTVIEKYGPGTFYVFDCLSELTVDWYSDRMLANFFMLTCPYLYDYDTATYFSILRNHHTTGTIDAIHNTAQVVLDLYKYNEEVYMQPLKVYKRHTKTMYMLHYWKDNRFYPVKKSTVISEILKKVPHPWLDFSVSHEDMWNRVFAHAQKLQKKIDSGKAEYDREYEEYRQRLLKMVVTREDIVLKLAEKYFDLSDLIDIGKHMVGTGLVGGKTVGMLLARAILEKDKEYWQKKLEPHDSFFIGSDVFYTYLIKSKCWWVRWKQRHSDNFLEGAEEAQNRMLHGTFPEDIQNQFKEILNYFGQSPVIVRSSSLLENAYGNSFSGKYESVFCANQGTPEERLDDFLNAVRKVYSSTMDHNALMYRYRRGLLDRDEQMALLVQRVSGTVNDNYFYPQIAGVGFSYNLYVWNKDIDPKAGVLRVVFGLGTRAVERHDDDYTRLVAVNEPGKRPEANFDELRKYVQRKVDVLDLESNRMVSEYFSDLAKKDHEFPFELYVSRDMEMEGRMSTRPGKKTPAWILTFDKLFSDTGFIKDLKEILRTLQDAYDYPVDIEFTANFNDRDDFKINLLQCRPYQVRKGIGVVKEPGKIEENNLILKTRGPIIGSSIHSVIDRLVYVVPSEYSKLSETDRYQVAHIIGRITNIEKDQKEINTMLLGPGRWGTSTPSLGVPVKFTEINNVSVICEIAEMHEGLVPDVSLGTHFFNDLVEMDILYMALYPEKDEYLINREFFAGTENNIMKLLPDAGKWSDIIKVMEVSENEKDSAIYLNVNSVEQRGVCYKDRKDSNG
ncbi:MAG: PEP/pyruvate-binding domain-containing protein [Elusimicrobiota bacterium]